MAATDSRQRTVPVTCAIKALTISPGCWIGRASTLATTGTTGGLTGTFDSASAMASAAGCISAQWKGADTGSSMARRAPLLLAISTARSTAALSPDTTTCPPPLSLAASQTWPCAASLATAAAASKSRPSSAAMAPAPPGTAFGRAWPRRRSSRAASAIEKVPAAASAEYSPSEWPATNCASRWRSSPASTASTRTTASDTAISAGCAFSVSISVSAGPSKITAESLAPSAASTSANTSQAGAKLSASVLPMPTLWLPCPGKTNADPMPLALFPLIDAEPGPRDTGLWGLSTASAPVTNRQPLSAKEGTGGRLGSPMGEPAEEGDLARVRADAEFRRQLLTESLERLLAALNRARITAGEPKPTQQLREGVDLALELADRLQR